MKQTKEGYYVEHNGCCWQSVFPSSEQEKSQLHDTVEDAIEYMTEECGVSRNDIHAKVR